MCAILPLLFVWREVKNVINIKVIRWYQNSLWFQDTCLVYLRLLSSKSVRRFVSNTRGKVQNWHKVFVCYALVRDILIYPHSLGIHRSRCQKPVKKCLGRTSTMLSWKLGETCRRQLYHFCLMIFVGINSDSHLLPHMTLMTIIESFKCTNA